MFDRPDPVTLEEMELAKARKASIDRELSKRDRRRRRFAEKVANQYEKNRVSLLWGMHEGYDAFVVGTGTSLAGLDFTRLHGRKNTILIGLNDAIKAPGFVPDYSIFCDVNIWKRYNRIKIHPKTKLICQKRARDNFVRDQEFKYIDQVYHFNHCGQVISCQRHNDDIFVARTVATGGIMLAWKMGCRRIFLLGVDGYKLKSKIDGGVYYYDGSSKGPEAGRKEVQQSCNRIVQDRHGWWQKDMKDLRTYFDSHGVFQDGWRGSNVYNLSLLSTIDAWEKVNPRKVL
jgi:hypothetical protein